MQQILLNFNSISDWQTRVGELGRGCDTAFSVLHVLSGAARGGPSRLGSFEVGEVKSNLSSPAQDTSSVGHPELLHPVSTTIFPFFRTQTLENLSVDSVTNHWSAQ